MTALSGLRDDYDDYERRPRLDRADANQQKDREHLTVLSILYFVLTGMQFFGLLGALVYVVFGIAIVNGPPSTPGSTNPFPPEVGVVMIVLGVIASVLVTAFAVCLGLTGNYLRMRTHRTFCFVIACLICINLPLGTLLGIFTIMVLQRESVKKLFASGGRPTADRGWGAEAN